MAITFEETVQTVLKLVVENEQLKAQLKELQERVGQGEHPKTQLKAQESQSKGA